MPESFTELYVLLFLEILIFVRHKLVYPVWLFCERPVGSLAPEDILIVWLYSRLTTNVPG